jgi:post-segregation antitoxin (ccd killing protein)
VAATSGFEDVGMHAAYRTGQSRLWTIEVLEAQAETSPNADFIKLFEIEVSTDRR